MTWIRSCRPGLGVILAIGLGTACRALPAPPLILPDHGDLLAIGESEAVLYAPTQVRLATPTGPRSLRTRWEGFDGAQRAAIFDPRLMLTKPLTDRWQVAGHITWSTLGVEA